MNVRPIYIKTLSACVVVAGLGLLVALFSYYRFGSNPRLAFGVLENCEAAVLNLVRAPLDMRLLSARIFPEGFDTLPKTDTNAFEVKSRYKTLVQRAWRPLFTLQSSLCSRRVITWGLHRSKT
ncbi:hypothetical protein AA042_21415 [Pseudomonas lundensis]|nr:hypothetical protein AA042_21415 [Pseudomonas lundensis]